MSQSAVFQYDSIYSSYLRLLNSGLDTDSLFSGIFGFFSTIAYFLNRSEMWVYFLQGTIQLYGTIVWLGTNEFWPTIWRSNN